VGLGIVLSSSAASGAGQHDPPCDFDANGYSELLIPTPMEGIAGSKEAGGISVLYGSSDGPTTKGDLFITRETPGISGGVETGDWFGQGYACGDFDADGYDDLVITAPGDHVGGKNNAGSLVVIHGSSQGLRPKTTQKWSMRKIGLVKPRSEDRFGWSVASCDFDGDGYDDLAVGAPGARVSGARNAGSVHVIYGSADGLSATGAGLVGQSTPSIPGLAEEGDSFGWALACGDIHGNGKADLVVGAPFDRVGTTLEAGTVTVVKGRSNGLRGTGAVRLDQGDGKIGGQADIGDAFGFSVTIGDFDSDNRMDIAVGSPREAIGLKHDAGAVVLIYGGSADLAHPEGQIISRTTPGVKGSAEAGARLGWSLTSGDFNDDGYADLGVGSPGTTVDGRPAAGSAAVLFGSGSGLSVIGDLALTQGAFQVPGLPESGDQFGWSLMSATVRGSVADLIISAPGEDIRTVDDGGTTTVVFGCS